MVNLVSFQVLNIIISGDSGEPSDYFAGSPRSFIPLPDDKKLVIHNVRWVRAKNTNFSFQKYPPEQTSFDLQQIFDLMIYFNYLLSFLFQTVQFSIHS